jgi:CheY-like chemotaxis protein
MLVDDELYMLSALQRLLRVFPCRYGETTYPIELTLFNTPLAALDQARHKKFDLVITDYRMPDMNGIDFLTALRQIQPAMKRILLTSAILPAVIETPPVDAGIDRYLAKPCDEATLLGTIAELLHDQSNDSCQSP